MKTIIAGSRNIADYFCEDYCKCKDSSYKGIAPCEDLAYNELVKFIDKCPWEITQVISGTAKGVDRLGERWAKENNIPCVRYPAKWAKYGKSAGPIRNAEMADVAEATIVLWDGVSKGTNNMIKVSRKKKLGLIVKDINNNENIDHLFD